MFIYPHADIDLSLLPEDGIYQFELGAANAVLNFTVCTPDSYRVHLNVTESDHTHTTLEDIVTVFYNTSLFHVHGAGGSLEFVETSEGSVLKANSKRIMAVRNIWGIRFSETDLFQYQNSALYDYHGNLLVGDISTLFLCDKYKVYQFDANMNNPVHGRGVLFFNRDTGVAIYFELSDTPLFTAAISQLEDTIHAGGSAMPEQSMSSGDGSLSSAQQGERDSLMDGSASRFVRDVAIDPSLGSGDSSISPEEKEGSHTQQNSQNQRSQDEGESSIEHSSRNHSCWNQHSMGESQDEESSQDQDSRDESSQDEESRDEQDDSQDQNSHDEESSQEDSSQSDGSAMFVRSAGDPPLVSGDYPLEEMATVVNILTQEQQGSGGM